MKRSSGTEYFLALKYFFVRFPRRTSAVFGAAILLAGLELISLSMVLPLFALGDLGMGDSRLVALAREAITYMGLSYSFYAVFFILVSAFVLKIVGELVLGIFIANSTVLIARYFRQKVIDGLKSVSWDYLTEKPHGLVVNLLAQEVDRAAGIFNVIKNVTVSAFMSFTYVSLGMFASTKLFIAAGLMGAAAFLCARPMMTMARRAGAGHVESLRNLATDLTQGLQAFKAFKAMAREHELLSTLLTANDSYVNAGLMKTRAQYLLNASQQLVLVVAVVASVVIAHRMFGTSLIEIGFMAVVLLRLNGSIANLLKKHQAIVNTYYTLGKMEEFTVEMTAQEEQQEGAADPAFPAEIRFEGISFNRGNRPILKNVSLTIPREGLTTIIGPSGSGKTTIIDLICGFYKPDEGRILLGDKNLQEINIRKWRQLIGYVSQEPILLHQSIAQNVAAFDAEISKEKIVDALEQAGARVLVESLSEGIDTDAGVSGQRLSGGERQRITIARALAKRPKLLILDEPTASVDPESEREIIETICKISQRIPVVAISHQPALAEVADVKYRIEAGSVSPVEDTIATQAVSARERGT
ncbi:MAG: ABC transporter ATP-binding protein/permease [Rhodospirillales bacterium]|nr:ABC transporter ATP-binding protein/permease [Rhodospirillales bacterium]